MNHGITNSRTGGKFIPGQAKGDGKIHQKEGSTISFYSVTEKKKINVPRSQVHFGKNKRGMPVMIAKGAGKKKDGSTFDLHRTGHA